jgi:hypothetical protein
MEKEKGLIAELAAHALKAMVTSVVAAVTVWGMATIGGQFEVVRCGIEQWFGSSYCM